jgi:hypothetical protein
MVLTDSRGNRSAGGMILTAGVTEVLGEKPVPVPPLYHLQISHVPTWDRARASAVTGWA